MKTDEPLEESAVKGAIVWAGIGSAAPQQAKDLHLIDFLEMGAQTGDELKETTPRALRQDAGSEDNKRN